MSTQAIELGPRTVLQLSGADRQRYLNGQVSNDVRKLDGENSIAACVTTIKGKLDALVRIIEHGDAYLIESEPELRESLFARLDRYIIADDCELADLSDEWRVIHLLGGAAGGADGLVSRSSERFGQPGIDLWLPAGEPLPSGLEILSAEAAESLRIRNGVPMWGRELTPDTLPAEAGLDVTAIDFHKGCYIGQEVISRIKSVGRVNRKLACLRVVGEVSPGEELCAGMRLIDGDAQVGALTSVAGHEALGFVKRDHDQPGTRLSLAPAAAGDTDNDQKKILSTSLEIVESRQA